MPIRPENLKRYPIDWKHISASIKARAEGRCECEGECGLHQHRRCEERHGEPAKWAKGRIVLTVAHLDHQPENCDPSNLKAMCQRCHLRYDVAHHRSTARRTRETRSGQQRLNLVAEQDRLLSQKRTPLRRVRA